MTTTLLDPALIRLSWPKADKHRPDIDDPSTIPPLARRRSRLARLAGRRGHRRRTGSP